MEEIHGQALGDRFAEISMLLWKASTQKTARGSKKAVREALEGDGRYFVEYRQPRADRTLSWMETHGQAIYDESKHPVAMMGVCWDITRRKVVRGENSNKPKSNWKARVLERTSELETYPGTSADAVWPASANAG